MTREEAAKIIDAISKEVAKDPNQFKLTITVAQIQATSHGGTALQVTAVGGAAGSRTTGMHNQMVLDNAQMKIVQQKGDRYKQEQVQVVVDSLNRISEELRVAAPDPSKLTALWDALKHTWLPGVITSVVGNLITMAATK